MEVDVSCDIRSEGFAGKLPATGWTSPRGGPALRGRKTTGDAVIPLTAATVGLAALVFKDVETGPMVRQFAKLPVRLEGRLSGTVEAHLPACQPGRQRDIRAELQIQSPRMTAERIPAEEVSGSVVYGPGGLDYRLAGLAWMAGCSWRDTFRQPMPRNPCRTKDCCALPARAWDG